MARLYSLLVFYRYTVIDFAKTVENGCLEWVFFLLCTTMVTHLTTPAHRAIVHELRGDLDASGTELNRDTDCRAIQHFLERCDKQKEWPMAATLILPVLNKYTRLDIFAIKTLKHHGPCKPDIQPP